MHSRRHLSRTTFAVACVLSFFPALPSPGETATPDVVGLRPGMHLDAARSVMEALPGNPGPGPVEPERVGDRRLPTPWGRAISVLAAVRQSEGTDDRIEVNFMTAPSRDRDFDEVTAKEAGLTLADLNVAFLVTLDRAMDPPPTREALEASLVKKYGPPSVHQDDRMLWFWDTGGALISGDGERAAICERASANHEAMVRAPTNNIPEGCGVRIRAEITAETGTPGRLRIQMDDVSLARELRKHVDRVRSLAEGKRKAAQEKREVPKF